MDGMGAVWAQSMDCNRYRSWARTGKRKGYHVPGGCFCMKPYAVPGRLPGAFLVLLVALSALFTVPCPVSGATPPLFPYLTVSVANDSLSPDEDLEIFAAWNRDASVYRPPQSIDVRLYSLSSGSLVARYTIPEDDHTASDGSTRHFRGVIPSSELPAGRLLVVAVDPVSGADARIPINVTEPGPDYPDLQVQRHATALFFGIAAALLVALGTGLALLLRRP